MTLTKIAMMAGTLCVLGDSVLADTFTCTLTDTRNTGWLPDRLVVEVNADETMAKAFDPITFSTLGGLAQAQIQAENSVRIELRWTTGRYRNDRAMRSRDMPNAVAIPILYRATILRGGNKILLRATPEGFSNRFNAQGTCQVSDAPIESAIR